MHGLHDSSSPGLDRLIERQMRNWELSKSQKSETRKNTEKQVEDFITISRSIGTPGAEVAALLGKRLNWPVFDREILHRMSNHDACREALYASFDERDMNWLEDFVLNMEVGPEGRNDYFRRLCQTLLSIARSSHAIFLGRGADLILPQLSNGLRVRITARHDYCVHAYAKEHGIGIDQAIDEIHKEEVERIRFFRHHFRTESGDQTRHDLIINIERFTVPQAVDLILSALAIRDMMPESAPAAAEFIRHDRVENK